MRHWGFVLERLAGIGNFSVTPCTCKGRPSLHHIHVHWHAADDKPPRLAEVRRRLGLLGVAVFRQKDRDHLQWEEQLELPIS